MKETHVLPVAGSMSRAILEYFLDVGEASTEMARQDLASEYERNQLTHGMVKLRNEKFLTFCEGGMRVTALTKLKLEQERKANGYAGEIVPPADRNVYGPELKPSNYMRTTGTREGSDWSHHKSFNAPMTKPV